jgi:hypothetical protein
MNEVPMPREFTKGGYPLDARYGGIQGVGFGSWPRELCADTWPMPGAGVSA